MLPPRAYVFLGLNGLRILSIITILLVFSSSIVTLVHDVKAVNNFISGGRVTNLTTDGHPVDDDYIQGSTVPNQPAGAFWAVLNRLLIVVQLIVLFLAELGWPSKFFRNYFPVLGPDFGMGALGVIQCLLGAAVLSHHVDDFALASAFLLVAVGCLNILAGLIWREGGKSKRSLLSWRGESKDLLPTHQTGGSIPPFTGSPQFQRSHKLSDSFSDNKPGFGFGRQGEKEAGMKGFLITRPVEALPTFHPTFTGSGRLSPDSGEKHPRDSEATVVAH